MANTSDAADYQPDSSSNSGEEEEFRPTMSGEAVGSRSADGQTPEVLCDSSQVRFEPGPSQQESNVPAPLRRRRFARGVKHVRFADLPLRGLTPPNTGAIRKLPKTGPSPPPPGTANRKVQPPRFRRWGPPQRKLEDAMSNFMSLEEAQSTAVHKNFSNNFDDLFDDDDLE